MRYALPLMLMTGLVACLPESPEALRLHDIALYSNATDIKGLYSYFYGPPQTLVVGNRTVNLSEGASEDEFAVDSALLVGEQGYLTESLPKRSPPPTRVQYIPLTTDLQVEIGEQIEGLVYYDGSRWFTVLESSRPGTRTVVPRERLNGLQGLGQLTRAEAEMLQRVLEPRAPVAVTVMSELDLPRRQVDGIEEYLRTVLYVQQTMPTDETAYRPPARDLLWDIIGQGAQAVGETADYQQIRTEAELLRFWNRVHGTQLTIPPVPQVDFRRETILGIVLDSKPSGGYGIEIVDVRLEGNDIFIDVRETSPPPGSMTTQALTTPWVMVRVLRGDIAATWFRNPDTGALIAVARRGQ